MLPRCRCLDEPYPVPKFSIVEQDVKALAPQLREFLTELGAALLKRRQQSCDSQEFFELLLKY
jgi:hypothetical protein